MDIYQEVTNRIIASLEAGAPAWVQPWKNNSPTGLPYNAGTGRRYSGVNVALLWAEAADRGYASSGWLTYKQAQAVGGQVRRGEKGTKVVFWRMREVRDADTGELEQIPLAAMFTVFNEAQIDGLKPVTAEPVSVFTGHGGAEACISQSGASIHHGGNRAFYSPAADQITLPERSQFKSPADYYATALHELVHWSGHASRLNRSLKGRFGDEAYAAEELIAELGAAFLCASLGVEGKLQHEGYIASWLRVLKNDKRAIFTASSAAQKAADFLLKREVKAPAEAEAA